VLHARDVVLLLRPMAARLDPGRGKRLASFKAVSAVITLFGFSLAAEVLVVARLASA